MLYKVALTFECVDEPYQKVVIDRWKLLDSTNFCGAVYHAVQGGSIFWVCGWTLSKSGHWQMKAIGQY